MLRRGQVLFGDEPVSCLKEHGVVGHVRPCRCVVWFEAEEDGLSRHVVAGLLVHDVFALDDVEVEDVDRWRSVWREESGDVVDSVFGVELVELRGLERIVS